MSVSSISALPGSYDYGEVARSVFIAIVASYVALDLAGRVTVAKGRTWVAWWAGGATAMGIGIFEMHLKGMLAFHLPVHIRYHWPTLLASLLIAVFASALALYVVSRPKMGRLQALTGSIAMGGGIAGLHYTGMAAMRLPAITRYSPLLVTASILLAILFSLIALLLAFDLRSETKWIARRRLGSAVVMGAAVSAMHYTGMAAASFFPSSPPDLSRAVNISPAGDFGVVIMTLLVLLGALITSSMDRQGEAVVLRLNQELEQRVIERTTQLSTLNEELRKEMTERLRAQEALQESQAKLSHVTRVMAMGELVASIAHEVNQPLTGVVTNANFCLRQLASTNPNLAELQEALTEIVNDGTRASAIISRVRALLARGSPNQTALDINEAIREVTDLVRHEVDKKGVSVRLDLASDLPPVFGDRVQLQQVLINLVINAVEEMSAHPDRPSALQIRTSQQADVVVVGVQDSGIGLSPGKAERIFEPFFTTKAEGVGLGLWISRSIVESHGGRLWGDSNAQGALFQFTVPTDGKKSL